MTVDEMLDRMTAAEFGRWLDLAELDAERRDAAERAAKQQQQD